MNLHSVNDDLRMSLVCLVPDPFGGPFHYPVEDPDALVIVAVGSKSRPEFDFKFLLNSLSHPIQRFSSAQSRDVVSMDDCSELHFQIIE